jgi:hypothetical protein
MQLEPPPKENAPHNAIISIGPQTNAVIDAFELRDEIIPHLRFLIRHTRSQLWEMELRKDYWQFTEEQAKIISCALIADVSTAVSCFILFLIELRNHPSLPFSNSRAC